MSIFNSLTCRAQHLFVVIYFHSQLFYNLYFIKKKCFLSGETAVNLIVMRTQVSLLSHVFCIFFIGGVHSHQICLIWLRTQTLNNENLPYRKRWYIRGRGQAANLQNVKIGIRPKESNWSERRACTGHCRRNIVSTINTLVSLLIFKNL